MNDSSDRNVIRFPKETVAEIESEAAHWLMRMSAESPTLGDIVEFELWRAGSADRDRIYKELQRIWFGVSERQAPHAAAAVERKPARSVAASLPSSSSRSFWPVWPGWTSAARPTRPRFDSRFGLAASVTALFVGVAAMYQYVSFWRYDHYTTARQIQTLTLADGSKVSLKGGTAINVQVSATGLRKVEVVRGEAYFEVIHDEARPFVVDMGSGLVKDIGTAFSVERRGETGRVRVEEGVVEVDAAGQSQVLVRGQQIGFGLYRLGQRSAIDPDLISAWRRGLYIAENKALGEVLSELNEYHPGRIVVLDDALRARRVNAVVQLDRIDAWLDTLGETGGVVVQRWGPLVVVSARAV